MRVRIDDLLAAMTAVTAYLHEIEQSEVDLEQDYYWAISDGRVYDMNAQPSEFTVGQLSEDLTEVQSASKDASGHHLVHLEALLRAYGESVKG